MRRLLPRLLFLASFAAACSQALAGGTVKVSFIEADKFADFGVVQSQVDNYIQILGKILVGVGERNLRDGQSLTIQVLDVDLAGTAVPGTAIDQVRVVQSFDWTRMHLRYELKTGDGPPVIGDEWVTSKGQTWRQGGEPLNNERRMLDRWFQKTFADK